MTFISEEEATGGLGEEFWVEAVRETPDGLVTIYELGELVMPSQHEILYQELEEQHLKVSKNLVFFHKACKVGYI